MSKINEMSIEEIFSKLELLLKADDLDYFFNNEELIEKFLELNNREKLTRRHMKQFLIENKEYVDKEKLLLILIKNYRANIKYLEKELKLNNDISLKMEKDRSELSLERARKMADGIDQLMVEYRYDKKENRYWIEIIDSKELISGHKRNKNKKSKKFKQIDKDLKERDPNHRIGIEYIFNVLFLTDFSQVFAKEELGDAVRNLILDNNVLKNGTKTGAELNKLRFENPEEYTRLIENQSFYQILPGVTENVEKYLEYIDLDKLVMICSYRYEHDLENKNIRLENPQDVRSVNAILQVIYNNMKGDNKKYNFSIQFKEGDKYITEDVTYSVGELEQCLKRFTSNRYLSKEEIEIKKQEVTAGKTDLLSMELEEIPIIFSNKELEEVALLSDENLLYVSVKLNWDREKMINAIKNKGGCSEQLLYVLLENEKLYYTDIIDMHLDKTLRLEEVQFLEELDEKGKLSELVNPKELINYYNKANAKDATKKDKDNFERYALLCKILKCNNEENKREFSERLMEELIENYNHNQKQKYLDQQKEFFAQDVLSMDSIMEWNEKDDIDSIIRDLYIQSTIDLKYIRQLIAEKKLEFEYMEKLASEENMPRKKRMDVLNQGWVPENVIYKLFEKGQINNSDLRQLAKKNIIDKAKAESLIRNSKKTDGEDRFEIIISGDLQKIKPEEMVGTYGNGDDSPNNKNRLIINPNQRLEFFKLLGARRVNKVTIPKGSPFYEYEFFALPDKNGDYSNDSVVIAERFYEETEEHIKEKIEEDRRLGKVNQEPYLIKYAVDNATYFFRGRDIGVLKEYSNKTEASEKEGIVFRANHNLADDKKDGDWASGVLYAITKTMLSSDMKQYKRSEQRRKVVETLGDYYGHERFMQILDKLEEIDLGYWNSELLDEYEDVR